MSDASLDVFSFQCLHLEFYLLQAAAVATATGAESRRFDDRRLDMSARF